MASGPGCSNAEPEAKLLPGFRSVEGRPVFFNSLGMQFVHLPESGVWLSIWETRNRDYQPFLEEAAREWPALNFPREPDHPAVHVSWDDTRTFCWWLTEKERKTGLLGPEEGYRLPYGKEWSEVFGSQPFPWGASFPPTSIDGNYDLATDPFDTTSPVGQFPASPLGIHDLGGNVWEWGMDWKDDAQLGRVLKGGSWRDDSRELLSTAKRIGVPAHVRTDDYGFRTVLVLQRSETGPLSIPEQRNYPVGVEREPP